MCSSVWSQRRRTQTTEMNNLPNIIRYGRDDDIVTKMSFTEVYSESERDDVL